MASIPKDAAAVIMLKDRDDPRVFWVKRNPKLAFMGGFHAFPGGQLDKGDASISVAGCDALDEATMRACAARELFEETGVLLAGGAERITPRNLVEKRGALASGEKTFAQILDEDDLRLEAGIMVPAGRWVTPAFAPRRFDTWFFIAWLPEGQEARIEQGELVEGEWIRPADALARWTRGEIIMAPPTLHAIRTLAECSRNIGDASSSITQIPEANRGAVRRIEFLPGMFIFPVRTPTLPPATHTNCYIAGGSEIIVIDPASPYEEEQRQLDEFLDGLISEGRRVREIFLTHHHMDHAAGSNHLRARLGVKVAAHRLTAERLRGSVKVDRFVEDQELIEIEGDPGWRIRALHTPGHTRGHLCFYEEKTGAILTGDLVVGMGTVVIDPPEGNMLQYLNSLARLLALPKLSSLFPAHGPVIGSARNKIEEYVEHRAMREARILDAIRSGAGSPADIVASAYTDVSPSLYPLAERSTIAHLEKLVEECRVMNEAGRYRVSSQ
jgi:glyoxylase-like metal-dependent hydrolase (beta-lactamase superfamily II)/8-oxo-dGTP pyrophosphatase MutT (NUDIX family)